MSNYKYVNTLKFYVWFWKFIVGIRNTGSGLNSNLQSIKSRSGQISSGCQNVGLRCWRHTALPRDVKYTRRSWCGSDHPHRIFISPFLCCSYVRRRFEALTIKKNTSARSYFHLSTAHWYWLDDLIKAKLQSPDLHLCRWDLPSRDLTPLYL